MCKRTLKIDSHQITKNIKWSKRSIIVKVGKPVGDMFIMTDKPNINFYKIGESKVGRAGHVCCVTEDKNVLIHGGFGNKMMVHGDTRLLDFKLS
jgi:hypothetical protein